MLTQMKLAVIIAAAGCSARWGGGVSKVLLPLLGRPALSYSLDIFAASPQVERLVVAARPTDMAEIRHICLPYVEKGARIDICPGGGCRGASVAAALQALAQEGQLSHIAVHDGARPLLHAGDWQALLAAAQAGAAALVLAAPPVDSIKQVREGRISRALPRQELAAAQTPQLFRAELLRQAYHGLDPEQSPATDDAELVQALGCPVKIVWAERPNFKLTFRADLAAAEAELSRRQAGADAAAAAADGGAHGSRLSPRPLSGGPHPHQHQPAGVGFNPRAQGLGAEPPVTGARQAETETLAGAADRSLDDARLALRESLAALETVVLPGFRLGQGWDSHALVPGRELVLGGVLIPHPWGLLGHSDADVLVHAIIDALLGGAGLPDIGRQFPDSDPAYAGISSLLLLERTAGLLQQAGWETVNLDATVIAQQPRLAPYIEGMRANIAQALGLSPDLINVKAKTAEGLDSVGQGLALQALAAVLLRPLEPPPKTAAARA